MTEIAPKPAFEQGSVVRLKSGGPKMTVESGGTVARAGDSTNRRPTRVNCIWHDGSLFRRESFQPYLLEKIDP